MDYRLWPAGYQSRGLLMKPEVGDSVLIASDGSGGAICAVIERSPNSSAVWELSGEMNIWSLTS